jgi:hypothetical protein
VSQGDQAQNLVNNITTPGAQPPSTPAGPPLPLPQGGGQQPPAYQGGGMVDGLVTNVTNPGGGPRQLNSMADLMGLGGAPVGGGSGNVSYSPEQIQGFINKYEQVLQGLMNTRDKAWPMAQVTAPVDEDASHGFARTANNSGQAFLDSNQNAIDYVKGEIEKLTAVLNQYNRTEQANAEQAQKIHRRI